MLRRLNIQTAWSGFRLSLGNEAGSRLCVVLVEIHTGLDDRQLIRDLEGGQLDPAVRIFQAEPELFVFEVKNLFALGRSAQKFERVKALHLVQLGNHRDRFIHRCTLICIHTGNLLS